MDNEKVENEINIDSYINKIKTKDVDFTLHILKFKNPAELLEKFYLLREDTTLSNEQKNEEMKKIMTEYMG